MSSRHEKRQAADDGPRPALMESLRTTPSTELPSASERQIAGVGQRERRDAERQKSLDAQHEAAEVHVLRKRSTRAERTSAEGGHGEATTGEELTAAAEVEAQENLAAAKGDLEGRIEGDQDACRVTASA